MTTQTSFHIDGFWFHVTWNSKGTIGIDQHGTTWYRKNCPRSEYGLGVRPAGPLVKKALSIKDEFMRDREIRQAAYLNRLAGGH